MDVESGQVFSKAPLRLALGVVEQRLCGGFVNDLCVAEVMRENGWVFEPPFADEEE